MKANHNILNSSLKLIFRDFLGEFLYFPVWWYTRGVKNAWLWFISEVKDFEYRFAVILWIKNIFVPMYGQHDWQGRLISVLMRIVQIIARGILFVFVFIFLFLGFILWLVFPFFVIYQLYLNLSLVIF